MIVIILISLIIVVIIYVYSAYKRNFKVWKELNVPYIEPRIPFGNFGDFKNDMHFNVVCGQLYEKLKNKGEYAGIYLFQKPYLFATSPKFAKKILIEDSNIFMDRGVYSDAKNDPLTRNLFFLEGKEWKNLRQKLSPAFSSGKMKIMFNTLVAVGNELAEHVNNRTDTEFDIKDLMACFTTDVISSCIFGLEGSSIKNPNSEFRNVGKKVMTFSKLQNVFILLATMFKSTAKKLKYRIFDKESTEFFINMVTQTINYRKENNVHRNDLMQTLMEMLNEGDKETGLTMDEIAANAFIFFFAGFDTSSLSSTYTLYQLALHEDVQQKVRAEIEEVIAKHNNKLTYESLQEMDYLHRTIYETLRIFPPIASLHRITRTAYKLPNGSVIPEGTNVIIPTYGLHHDSDIYVEPEKFDPDRFLDNNKNERHSFSYLPFGEGPRICIGLRFALMQIQVGVISILRNFEIKVSSKTEIPIKFDSNSLSLSPKGNVWLKLCKLEKEIVSERKTVKMFSDWL